ncbi:MAG: bifunctional DNA primase/polymerase [Hyphomicrobium sp.]
MSTTDDRQKAIHASLVQQYLDAGWHCLPLVQHGKKAFQDEWQTASFDEENFRRHLKLGCNVGVRLDGDLIDLDFDRPEARRLSSYFFPECPAFRRETLPADAPGHRIVRCSNPSGKTVKFQFTGPATETEAIAFFGEKPMHARKLNDPKPKLCIVEIRNGKAQTGFPPSIYDNGRGGKERLVWNEAFSADGIPVLSLEDITKRTARLAFASMALKAYPIGQGSRDEFCLRLAGALVALGWDAEDGDDLVVHIATLAGDEEAEARRGKVAKTIERKDAGEQVSGLPAFLEMIGFASAEKNVRKWFNVKRTKAHAVAEAGAIPLELENYERNAEFVRQLKAKDADIFLRGGELILVRKWGEPHITMVAVGKGEEAVQIAYADIHSLNWRVLRTYASQLGIRFCSQNKDGIAIPEPDPKQDVYEDILKSPHLWSFRKLRGLSLVPTLTRSEPGYDEKTGLYLTFPEGKFPAVADAPTRADAEAALARLLRPVRAFEWENPEVDRSVFVSSVMSATIRASHRGLYPMFTFDAKKSGSGKTKAMLMAGTFANGGVLPPVESWNPSPQEFDKKLVANLIAGVTCIAYDNVTSKIGGQEIEGVLTAGEAGYKSRVLGVSENRRVPADIFFVASGNCLEYSYDVTRRVLRCALDPTADRPDERCFDFDPIEEMLSDFPARVVDVLTILKAFQASGERPKVIGSDLTGFRLVQSALVWLGMADPLLCKQEVRARDTDTQVKGQTIHWLFERFQNREFRAWEVAAKFDDLRMAGLVPQTHERSRQTTAAICGTILAGLVGVEWNGMVLKQDTSGQTKIYRVVGLQVVAQGFTNSADVPF